MHQRNSSQHKLMLLGDSNLNGIRPREMAQKIRSRVFITKQAFSGATASHLNHYSDISLQEKPDSIIIHGGTNDLYGRNSNQNSADEVACQLIEISVKARSSGVRNIFISSILPINEQQANAKSMDINSLLKTYCEAYNFVLINNSNLTNEDLKENDPVHLSLDGREEMVKNFIYHFNQF